MQLPLTTAGSERAAAVLETVILIALTALCLHLFRRYRKPYFAWFAAAWGLYVLRMAAILSFLSTADRAWLYWHQVITGWTALALLWAALVFSRQVRWRPTYLLAALFPLLWAYIAIYQLDNFFLAAGPAVLRTRRGVGEVITTLLLNFVALEMASWAVRGNQPAQRLDEFARPSHRGSDRVSAALTRRPGVPGRHAS